MSSASQYLRSLSDSVELDSVLHAALRYVLQANAGSASVWGSGELICEACRTQALIFEQSEPAIGAAHPSQSIESFHGCVPLFLHLKSWIKLFGDRIVLRVCSNTVARPQS